jgi:hypothetical protein
MPESQPASPTVKGWPANRPEVEPVAPKAAPVERPGGKTVAVVRGQYHKFMLIPIQDAEADFFPAGPITFGIESRVLGHPDGRVGERGASLHVFNADRSEEYIRFDCFERIPHYHYILNGPQHNIVWGYDEDANGPMLDWAIGAIRNRLPIMLRTAGADDLAERIEKKGYDLSVLDRLYAAMIDADARTRPGTVEQIMTGVRWMARWKEIHPQFNTVEY